MVNIPYHLYQLQILHEFGKEHFLNQDYRCEQTNEGCKENALELSAGALVLDLAAVESVEHLGKMALVPIILFHVGEDILIVHNRFVVFK